MDVTTHHLGSNSALAPDVSAIGDVEPEFRLGYRRWLDGLRGIAVVAVLAFHFQLLPGGSLGVDIFFVLSGFLITALLLDEWKRSKSIRLGYFYARRALRLLPAFIFLLAVCSIATAFNDDQGSYYEILIAACYVSNWPSIHHTGMPRLGHTWSLSVEEQFYLIWPVVLIALLRSGLSRKAIVAVACAGILASASLRICLYRQYPDKGPDKSANVIRLYMGSDTRADSLLVGCLTAMLVSWNFVQSLPVRKLLGAAACVAVVVLGFLLQYRTLDHSQYYHGLFTLAAILIAVIIGHMIFAPSRMSAAVLEWAPLVAIGQISYGLYLYHIPIIAWMKPAGLGWRHPWPTLQIAALSLVAACASYVLIERPCLSLKRRFESSRNTPMPADSDADVRRVAA